MKKLLIISIMLPLCAMEQPEDLSTKHKKEKLRHFSSEEKRAYEDQKIKLLKEQIKIAKITIDLKHEDLKFREQELVYLQRQAEALEMRETIAVLTLMAQYQMLRAQIDPSPSQFQDEKILRNLMYKSLKQRYPLPEELSWVKKEAAQEQARAAKSSSNSAKENVMKGG